MMCDTCSHAEYRGFPPKGSPEWEVGTVYFWCPMLNTHGLRMECDGYEKGTPKRFDKRGDELR